MNNSCSNMHGLHDALDILIETLIIDLVKPAEPTEDLTDPLTKWRLHRLDSYSDVFIWKSNLVLCFCNISLILLLFVHYKRKVKL